MSFEGVDVEAHPERKRELEPHGVSRVPATIHNGRAVHGWNPQALAEPLWKLFEHKSKLVRSAAARALVRIGDDAVARASELLSAKKSVVREAAVMLLAVAARHFFGEAGLIGLAAISGLADVDAITLSMAKTAGSDATSGPGLTILTAVGVYTIAKTAYAAYVGGVRLGLIVAGGTVVGLVAAAAAWLMLPFAQA